MKKLNLVMFCFWIFLAGCKEEFNVYNLIKALPEGNKEKISAELDLLADPNFAVKMEIPVLIYSIYYAKDQDTALFAVEKLVKKGADVNKSFAGVSFNTGLYASSRKGYVDVFDYLKKHGSKVAFENALDSDSVSQMKMYIERCKVFVEKPEECDPPQGFQSSTSSK